MFADRPRLNWPFDAATTIATVALLMSGLQLVVSSPVLWGLYFKPRLVGHLEGIERKPFKTIYRFENRGNATAHHVELSVLTQKNDRVIITPDIAESNIPTDNEAFVSHRIVISHQSPSETFEVTVIGDDRLDRIIDGAFSPDDPPNTLSALLTSIAFFPTISALRSEEGPGELDTLPPVENAWTPATLPAK